MNWPFHSLWRHLGWEANMAKIIVNVWNFGPLGAAITPLQWGGFPQRKCLLEVIICTEIIFMKYEEEIQVITTVNEFLRFHNQHYASYHENRSHKRRFIIRIYAARRTFFNRLISIEWMISIKLFKVVANVGNPPLCSGVIAFPSGPKSHTLTVILAVFAPQPRWRHQRHKPWEGQLVLDCHDQ